MADNNSNDEYEIPLSKSVLLMRISGTILVVNLILFLVIVMFRALTQIIDKDITLFGFALILFLISVIFTIITTVQLVNRWMSEAYMIKGKNLVLTKRYRSKFERETFNLSRAVQVDVHQSFGGKTLGYGSIIIKLKDQTIEINDVDSPHEKYARLTQMMRQ